MPARARSSTGMVGHDGRVRAESNARLTAATGLVLLVLFIVEVVTVLLQPRSVLTLHATVGLILVPPVVLKIASTTWRMMSYYRGDPGYRDRGVPARALRILGPFLVFLTIVVLASGVALVLIPNQLHSTFLVVHKASFYIWLGALVIHVAAHVRSMIRMVASDLLRRTAPLVAGAGSRYLAVAGSLLLGAIIGLALVQSSEDYLRIFPHK